MNAIDVRPSLVDLLLEYPFVRKTGLFEHPPGCGIVGIGFADEIVQLKLIEGKFGERLQSFRAVTSMPVLATY